MKSLILAAALGSLGLIGATPSQAHASWLSEAIHARYNPCYYNGCYGTVYPGYRYYAEPYYNY